MSRITIIGSAFSALALLLAGCSGTSNQVASPQATVTVTATATVTAEPVVTAEPEPVVEVAGPTPKKSAHEQLTSRQLAKIVKNPAAYAGDDAIVYAEVFQFDAAIGLDAFLGNVLARDANEGNYWPSSQAAWFNRGQANLDDVVEGDVVKVWATVGESFSYDTQAGGNTTVPVFTVNHIDVLRSAD
jgi:hypothetical protein